MCFNFSRLRFKSPTLHSGYSIHLLITRGCSKLCKILNALNSILPQANQQTYIRILQCSHISVGLTQARPNHGASIFYIVRSHIEIKLLFMANNDHVCNLLAKSWICILPYLHSMLRSRELVLSVSCHQNSNHHSHDYYHHHKCHNNTNHCPYVNTSLCRCYSCKEIHTMNEVGSWLVQVWQSLVCTGFVVFDQELLVCQ